MVHFTRSILAGIALLSGTEAHGYMSTPISRNAIGKQEFGRCSWGSTPTCFGDFMSLGGVSGPDSTGCTALGGKGDVTGSGSLSFATSGISTTYKQGAVIDIGIDVTAYHGGKFEFHLQDAGAANDPDGSQWGVPLVVKSFAPACIGCTIEPCAPAGGSDGTCAQIPLTKGDHSGHYQVMVQLPADVTCNHCVLQWHWTSSNSCDGGLACGASEQFWNCADIKIEGDGDSSTTPAPTTPSTDTTTNMPTAAPTTRITTPSDGGDTGACCLSLQSHIASSWCQTDCASMIAAYPDVCAASSCAGGGSDSDSTPPTKSPTAPPSVNEPATTPAPTPATSATPAPTAGGSSGAGDCNDFKSQCQTACLAQSGDVATSQCWGTPIYTECKCSDGISLTFAGFTCENPSCPSPSDPTDPTPTSAPATPSPTTPTRAPTIPAAATPAPTRSPSSSPPPAGTCGSERRIAYFANWAIYGRDFHPWDMDLGRLTHINYAFMDVNSQCEVVSGDSYADFEKVSSEVGQSWGDESVPKGSLGAFRIMRDGSTQTVKDNNLHFPNIKILLSLGGWTWSTHFSTCTVDATKRAKFVKSAVDMLAETDTDGIDVDWEYPTGCSTSSTGNAKCGVGSNSHDGADWNNYIAFMKELRKEMESRNFNRHMELTVAAGMAPALNSGAPLKEWVDTLDAVNFMAYDYMGGWNPYTAHQTALHPVTGLPAGAPTDYNIEETVQIFLDAGVPTSKMVLGLASYGRSWEGTTGLHKAAAGAGQGTWEKGIVSWHDLKANYIGKGDWQTQWDADAEAPYVYSPSKGELVVYDDTTSISIKAKWAQKLGFAGFMWWEASDDPTFDLHTAAVGAWVQQCTASGAPSRRLTSTPHDPAASDDAQGACVASAAGLHPIPTCKVAAISDCKVRNAKDQYYVAYPGETCEQALRKWSPALQNVACVSVPNAVSNPIPVCELVQRQSQCIAVSMIYPGVAKTRYPGKSCEQAIQQWDTDRTSSSASSVVPGLNPVRMKNQPRKLSHRNLRGK